MPALVPLKIGFTFLDKCVQAFQTIMRFEAMPLEANLFIERGFELLALFLDHAMFYVALREARAGGDAFSELLVSASNWSAGTTRLTIPMRKASSAESIWPV